MIRQLNSRGIAQPHFKTHGPHFKGPPPSLFLSSLLIGYHGTGNLHQQSFALSGERPFSWTLLCLDPVLLLLSAAGALVISFLGKENIIYSSGRFTCFFYLALWHWWFSAEGGLAPLLSCEFRSVTLPFQPSCQLLEIWMTQAKCTFITSLIKCRISKEIH